jgi:hypothetical protein
MLTAASPAGEDLAAQAMTDLGERSSLGGVSL